MKTRRVNTDNVIETDLEGSNFGIKEENVGFILGILREGMYQDPIGSVCREIISNCVDSHTEANRSDIPIQITLPSLLSSEIRFRDFGFGMSPEFVKENYTSFGYSTKSDTNEFIGGLGIGSKSPFAYSDSFTVETVYKGRKYIYSCYIDDSERGKIFKLHEEETKDREGTCVRIPIESKDWNLFREKVLYYSKYLPVQPVILGDNGNPDEWKLPEISVEGKTWSIYNKRTSNKSTILVGNVPYPLDTFSLDHSTRYDPILNFHVLLRADIGEVDVAANRENLKYTDKTKSFIKSKFALIRKELSNQVDKELASCGSLYEACLKSQDLGGIINSVLKNEANFSWKNYKVRSAYAVKDAKTLVIQHFTMGMGSKLNSKTRDSVNIYPQKKRLFYLNDLGSATPTNRIHTIFKDFGNDYEVLVIKSVDKNGQPITKIELENDVPMEVLDVRLLSTVTPQPKPPKKVKMATGTVTSSVTKPKNTLPLLEYVGKNVDLSKVGIYSQCEEVFIDPSVGGCYLLVNKGTTNILSSSSNERVLLDFIKSHFNCTLYLVRNKEASKIVGKPGWEDMGKKLLDYIDSLITEDYLDFTFTKSTTASYIIERFSKGSAGPSMLRDYVEHYARAKEYVRNVPIPCSYLVNRANKLYPNRKVNNLDEKWAKCLVRYPLLDYFNSSLYYPSDALLEKIQDYISLIDQAHNAGIIGNKVVNFPSAQQQINNFLLQSS
jgi:hypothetical protein